MEKEKKKKGIEIDFDGWSVNDNRIDEGDIIKEEKPLQNEQKNDAEEELSEEEAIRKELDEDYFVPKIREEFKNLEPVDFLGKGGFGRVYKCRQERAVDNEYYAVKIIELDKDNETEFNKVIREIEIQKKYSGDNLSVSIRDNKMFEEGAKRYVMILMDCMDGSLQNLIDTKGKLNQVEAVDIAIDICKILVEMEEEGDSHNDIKPANILYKAIRRRKQYQLGDFGSARNSIKDTGYSEPASTAAYRPIAGELSDVFSLGIVLMVMLGNAIPTENDKLLGKFRFKDTDPELQRICSKACAVKKDDRYHYASELKADLEAWKDNHPDEVNLYKKSGSELLKIAERLKKEDEASEVASGYRELTIRYLNEVIQKGSCPAKNPAIQKKSCSAMYSAMYHMYCIYEKAGKELERTGYMDKEKAEVYLEKAAKARYHPAMNSYVCFRMKKERRVDPEWVKMLREAASDYAPAQYNLSLLIRTGLADSIEEEEETRLLEKAVNAHYHPACKLLEAVHQSTGNQNPEGGLNE